MNTHFDIPFDRLPEEIPIFPLSGALLLPRCRLPLNIFEPRYMSMTEDALAGERLIGMVQLAEVNSDLAVPELFDVGCAGRVTSFSETDDGRMLIILTGVSRFRIGEELNNDHLYRTVLPDWEPFRADLAPEAEHGLDRERLYASLRVFFETRDLETDWEVLHDASDESLVNSLAMSCPFEIAEKQSLLEAPTLQARADIMRALLEMATLDRSGGELPLH